MTVYLFKKGDGGFGDASGFGVTVAAEPAPTHNESMTDFIPRPELDAKLETIEARMDGRVARIEDAILRMEKSNDQLRAEVKSDAVTFRTEVKADGMAFRAEMKAENAATLASISSLKSTVIVTSIGAVIAIVALSAAILSNMVASFDSGKGLATSLAETTAKVDAAVKRLEAVQPAAGNVAPAK